MNFILLIMPIAPPPPGPGSAAAGHPNPGGLGPATLPSFIPPPQPMSMWGYMKLSLLLLQLSLLQHASHLWRFKLLSRVPASLHILGTQQLHHHCPYHHSLPYHTQSGNTVGWHAIQIPQRCSGEDGPAGDVPCSNILWPSTSHHHTNSCNDGSSLSHSTGQSLPGPPGSWRCRLQASPNLPCNLSAIWLCRLVPGTIVDARPLDSSGAASSQCK